MPMTDGERKETIGYIRKTEELIAKQASGGFSQPDLREALKHILNVCKRLAGDQAPLVE